jgi:hypothetical protein
MTEEKKVILLIGAESTGTRIFTTLLSEHPNISGTTSALKVGDDILDNVWRLSHHNKIEDAIKDMPKDNIILTRRSVPHALSIKENAEYLNFPHLSSFYNVCLETNRELIMLITTRSPLANLNSWVSERRSPDGSIDKAINQYQKCYQYLLDFTVKNNIKYWILSLEGLILDKNDYLNGIYKLLDLPEYIHFNLKLNVDVNKKRY